MATCTVQTRVNATLDHVWECWNAPEHIIHWCSGSPDWHTPKASNNPVTGGKFCTTMAAKDGSMEFDFEGTYTSVTPQKHIAYIMADGRKAEIWFEPVEGEIQVTETFDMEESHTPEQQREGWQTILNNFKTYTEVSVT